MITLYSYNNAAMELMSEWLIENGTGKDWACYWANLHSFIPDNIFKHRSITSWVFDDDNVALIFKMMFSEHLFNSPQELYDGMLQKRKVLGIV